MSAISFHFEPALKFHSKARLQAISTRLVSPQTWKYARMRTWISEPPTSNNPNRGWRKAVLAAAITTAIVLLINVILAIVAATTSSAEDGIGTLFQGDCKKVEQWSTALHLLINVLGTCLLVASSFTMQCLSSPTRSEADRAHAKRVPLEIGVPSVKNLRHMHWWKGCLWWALCLSTLPLHLLWNSTIFSTIGAMQFDYLVVDESFFSGADYPIPNTTNDYTTMDTDITDPGTFLSGYNGQNYTRLSPTECLGAYMATYITSYRNLIVVTTPTEGMRMSPGHMFPTYYTNLTEYYGDAWVDDTPGYESIDMGWPQPLWNGSSVIAYEDSSVGGTGSLNWACLGWYTNTNGNAPSDCPSDKAQKQFQENGTWYLRPHEKTSSLSWAATAAYPVDYCLAETHEVQTCQLQYASYILAVVIACNIIKLVSMGLTAFLLWDLRQPIFATVGDAVASYIATPDMTTVGWCTMDYTDVLTSSKWKHNEAADQPQKHVYNRKPTARLYATSRKRWWITMSLCFAYLTMGIAFLCAAATYMSVNRNPWRTFGFDKATTPYTLHIGEIGSPTQALFLGVLLANSFQLILSMTYFLFNSLWTAHCAAREWASYAQKRKALRVTWPRGQQRSTYYLSLPYRYGVPLAVCLGLLHFLISQSIFLARIQWYNPNGTVDTDNYISDAGYSPLAILITVIVATVLLAFTVLHSFTKLDNRIPAHGNLSAVISAMCHTPGTNLETEQDGASGQRKENQAEQQIMWGVTKPANQTLSSQTHVGAADDSVGHFAFTAEQVEPPVIGMIYR